MASKNKRCTKGNGRIQNKSRRNAPLLSQQEPAAAPREQTQEEPQQPTSDGEAGTSTANLESCDEEYENDMEAGGAIAGELTRKLINYLDMQPQREDTEQEEQEQNQQGQEQQGQYQQDQDEEREEEQDEANENSQAQEDTIPEVEIHNT